MNYESTTKPTAEERTKMKKSYTESDKVKDATVVVTQTVKIDFKEGSNPNCFS